MIQPFPVRSYTGERSRKLRLYFDSGSPYTFVRKSIADRFKAVFRLPVPEPFGGLGNGHFRAGHLMNMEVKLLRFWCRHPAYVVGDDVLEPNEDVLVGHDFMQKFDVKINMKGKDIILNPLSLRRAQKVRCLAEL